MNVDHPDANGFSIASNSLLNRANAEAGPSSRPDVPPVFRPPPVPSSSRLPPFDSTQDLITRFQLLPTYDKYVRPSIHNPAASEPISNPTPLTAQIPGAPLHTPTSTAFDKGKGRDFSVGTPRTPLPGSTPAAAAEGGDGEDGDEDAAKGEKKKKSNSYKHLIKGIPGKHSLKKDDYLQTMMLVPQKQKMTISKFDLKTQREAFSVSLEGLKGWNIGLLIAESPQAREDRKRRKELKKLAKAQAQGLHPGATIPPAPLLSSTSSGSGLPSSLSATTPGLSGGMRHPQTPSSIGVGTPRPGPISANSSKSDGRIPSVQGLPIAHPQPHQGTPGLMQNSAVRSSTPRPGSADALARRGKKREHEEDSSLLLDGNGPKRSIGGIPSSIGTKPSLVRPMKKARTDTTPLPIGLPGLQREVPQQQPTPQGV